MKNQSAGVGFLTSIPYIEKKYKGKRGRSSCWSCSYTSSEKIIFFLGLILFFNISYDSLDMFGLCLGHY